MTSDTPRLRLGVIGIVAVSLFAALFARLWFLQVMTSPDYQAAAQTNGTRTVMIEAPRGRIFDRNGLPIVENKRSIVVSVDFQAYSKLSGADQQRLFNRLAAELSRDQPTKAPVTADFLRKRMTNPRFSHFKPVPVAQDVSPTLWVYLEEHAADFPTVSVDRVELRSYPYGALLAHVLGYVGAVNSDDLRAFPDKVKPYSNDSEIGKAGVERSMESLLRGVPGKIVYEVDARNRPIRERSHTQPIPGYDVYLTIDINMQAQAEKALASELAGARSRPNKLGYPPAPAGSVVAIDPNNGQVLAMASNPTYDPADFVGGISTERYDQLTDPSRFQPLTNRAVQGLYSPGSTFKLVTALAGLRKGVIDPNAYFYDGGTYNIQGCKGSSCTVRDSAGEVPGSVNLSRAISLSSDAYFYRVGDDFWRHTAAPNGPTPIQDAGADLGLGKKTGIQLPVESYVPLPTPALRKQLFDAHPNLYLRGDWSTGDNINLSIGQGDVQITPLQLANAYATFANGGTRYQPTLLLKVNEAFSTKTVATFTPKVLGTVEIRPEWRASMLSGFAGVTTIAGGTATSTFSGFPMDKFPVAGKTGTAEIGNDPKTHKARQDNSLFVGFGPAANPSIVVTAVMEQAGFGADVAAPVVRDILEPLALGQPYANIPGGFQLDANGVLIIPNTPTTTPAGG